MDSAAYVHLLHALDPTNAPLDELQRVLAVEDWTARAELMLDMAVRVDGSARTFLRAADIVEGRDKLNLCFLANLFNKCTGMAALHEELEAKNAQLEALMVEEQAKVVDLSGIVEQLRARIRELEQENSGMKEQLARREKDVEVLVVEKSSVQTELLEAARIWQAKDDDRSAEFSSLESKIVALSSDLAQAQADLEKERQQVETFEIGRAHV